MISLLPTLVSCSQQIAHTTVIAKNLIRYQAVFMIVSGTLGLAVSYVLSLYIGSIGVCVGTAVCSLSNIVYMSGIYKRKAGINLPEFYKKCWLKAIPCYVAVAIVGLVLVPLIPIAGWLGLFVKIAVVAVIYLTIMLFSYFSRQERKALLDRLKK